MFLSLFDHNPACIARPPRPRQSPRTDRRGVVAATDSWSSIGIPADQSGPALIAGKVSIEFCALEGT